LWAHYEKYTNLLREELGVQPGIDITRLFERFKGELGGRSLE